MKLKIVERKVEISDKTREKLEKKLAKFDRLFKDDEVIATATFTLQKEKIYLEIAITCGDMIIRAEANDADAKTAIDKIIGTIEGQFRKYKTKIEKKVKSPGYGEFYKEIGYSEKDEVTEFKVVKSKKFFVKPMSVDEAILQMNLLNHEFFVYNDAETDKVNIVYKRKDKNYGLIEVD